MKLSKKKEKKKEKKESKQWKEQANGRRILSLDALGLGKTRRRASQSNFQSNFFLDQTIALSLLREISISIDSTFFLLRTRILFLGEKKMKDEG